MDVAQQTRIVTFPKQPVPAGTQDKIGLSVSWDPFIGLTLCLSPECFNRVAGLVSPPPTFEITGSTSSWLTLVDAARHAGYECPKGRAPNSMYELAHKIGRQVKGRWVIHVDDLDRAIREGLLA